MFDHNWPAKRSRNIEEMYIKATKDTGYAFELMSTFLHEYSNFVWKMGDQNFSLLLATLANRAYMASRDKPKKRTKKRHKAR